MFFGQACRAVAIDIFEWIPARGTCITKKENDLGKTVVYTSDMYRSLSKYSQF